MSNKNKLKVLVSIAIAGLVAGAFGMSLTAPESFRLELEILSAIVTFVLCSGVVLVSYKSWLDGSFWRLNRPRCLLVAAAMLALATLLVFKGHIWAVPVVTMIGLASFFRAIELMDADIDK